MNIKAGLGEYILHTHNTKIFEDSVGGLNRPNPLLDTPVTHCIDGAAFFALPLRTETGRDHAMLS